MWRWCTVCEQVRKLASPEVPGHWELALKDILEPCVIDHGLAVVIGEGTCVAQEASCQQAVPQQTPHLSFKGLQDRSMRSVGSTLVAPQRMEHSCLCLLSTAAPQSSPDASKTALPT